MDGGAVATSRDVDRLHYRPVFSKQGIVRPPWSHTLERYWHQRYQLFSHYHRGVRLDAESWYSVTPEAVAAATARIMARGDPSCSGSRLVVDAFAGCGGNAIQQALHDPTGLVLAIDVDPVKVALARHNARIYGVEGRIEFVVGDFTALAVSSIRPRAHIVFLSPPWGGPAREGGRSARSGSADAAAGDGGDADGIDNEGFDANCGPAEADCVHQDSGSEFALARLPRPCCGLRLFELAMRVAPSIGYYLPCGGATLDRELAALAARHRSRRCEKVVLRWGGGLKKPARPRALLACFHAEPPEGMGEGLTARECLVGAESPHTTSAVGATHNQAVNGHGTLAGKRKAVGISESTASAGAASRRHTRF